MKTPIKIFALIFIIQLSATTLSSAQRGPRNMDPEKMAERQTEHLQESLNLTDEQMEKVLALNLKYANKFSEERSQADSDRNARREAMETIQSEREEEMKAILTDEQFQKFTELKEHRPKGPRKKK